MIVNAKLSTFPNIHTVFGKKIWIVTMMNWKQHYQNNWNFPITSKSAAIMVYYYECSWKCRHVLNVQNSLKIGHLANNISENCFCLSFCTNAKICSLSQAKYDSPFYCYLFFQISFGNLWGAFLWLLHICHGTSERWRTIWQKYYHLLKCIHSLDHWLLNLLVGQ